MKTCEGCRYAAWNRTKAGKLHPSGEGHCTYEYKLPPLPASRYWVVKPEAFGGFINRKKTFTDHCPYYTK